MTVNRFTVREYTLHRRGKPSGFFEFLPEDNQFALNKVYAAKNIAGPSLKNATLVFSIADRTMWLHSDSSLVYGRVRVL